MGWYFLAGVIVTGFAVFLYRRYVSAKSGTGSGGPVNTSKRDAIRSDVDREQ